MKKIILIVDGQREIRLLLFGYFRTYFQASSVPGKIMPEIVQAENGGQAWHFLTEGLAPDFMVIGYPMPKMDGVELIDKIQAELKQLKTKIVLFGNLPLKNEAKQKGCLFVRERIGGEGEILKLAAGMGIFAG